MQGESAAPARLPAFAKVAGYIKTVPGKLQ